MYENPRTITDNCAQYVLPRALAGHPRVANFQLQRRHRGAFEPSDKNRSICGVVCRSDSTGGEAGGSMGVGWEDVSKRNYILPERSKTSPTELVHILRDASCKPSTDVENMIFADVYCDKAGKPHGIHFPLDFRTPQCLSSTLVARALHFVFE